MNELAEVKTGALAQAPDISDLMKLAIEQGANGIDALEKLVALRERIEDRNARHAFHDALAEFQKVCPAIEKTKEVKFVSRSGGAPVKYNYAPLDAIVAVVRPILARLGLSFSWDSEEVAGKLTVACILRHVDGCSQEAKFTCPLTSSNPIMSDQQKSGGALTYARRQSLVQVLGLVTTDEDTDGADAETLVPIDENEVADLYALMDEVKADQAKFLEWLGVDRVEDIPKAQLVGAVQALERKRRAS